METKIKQTEQGLFWYQNGEWHREDGPAVEWFSGTKEWWQNGKMHREDGPALETYSGMKLWCLDGEFFSENEFNQIISKKKLNEKLQLNLSKKINNKRIKI